MVNIKQKLKLIYNPKKKNQDFNGIALNLTRNSTKLTNSTALIMINESNISKLNLYAIPKGIKSKKSIPKFRFL